MRIGLGKVDDGCVGQEDKVAQGPPGWRRGAGGSQVPCQSTCSGLLYEFSWDQKPLLLKTLFILAYPL